MGRIALATDNYNRADNVDIGSAWDNGWTSVSTMQIVSNTIRPSGSTISAESYNAVAFPDNQYSKAEIANLDTSDWVFVAVRMSTPPGAANWYMLIVRPGAGNTQLYRVDNAVLTSLALVANPGWVIGDTVSLEVVGSTLTAFRNDLTFGLSATDGTYASGRAGLGANTPAGLNAQMQLDNWEGGMFDDPASSGSSLVAVRQGHFTGRSSRFRIR